MAVQQAFFNPSDYDGATFFVEVNATSSSASAQTAGIEDITNAQTFNITVPANTSAYTRIRSSAISPTATTLDTWSAIYSLTTVHSAAARIIVQQSLGTKTAYEFPLKGFVSTESTLSTTFVELPNSNKVFFHFASADRDGTISIFFEAAMTNSGSSTTSTAALAVAGTTTAVTGSTVSNKGTTQTVVRSSAITLTDNTDYEAIIETSSSMFGATFQTIRLVISQSGAISKLMFARIVGSEAGSASSTVVDGAHRNLVNNISNATFFYEATIDSLVALAENSQLLDADANDSGTAGSAVATVTTSATISVQRLRSGSFSLTQGNRFISNITSSTTANNLNMGWILVAARRVGVFLSTNRANVSSLRTNLSRVAAYSRPKLADLSGLKATLTTVFVKLVHRFTATEEAVILTVARVTRNVSYFRSLRGVSTVSARITRTASYLRSFRATGVVSTRITSVRSYFRSLRADISALTAKMTFTIHVHFRSATFRADLSALTARLARNVSYSRSLRENISSLTTRLRTVRNYVRSLRANISTVLARVTTVRVYFRTLRANLSSIAMKLTRNLSYFRSFRATTVVSARLTSLRGYFRNLRADGSSLTTRVTTVRSYFRSFRADLSALRTKASTVKFVVTHAFFAVVRGDISALATRTTTVRNYFRTFRADLSSLGEKATAIKFLVVHAFLAIVRADISVITAKVATTHVIPVPRAVRAYFAALSTRYDEHTTRGRKPRI